MSIWRYEVLCPRCKTSMEYISEAERSGEIVISNFYRCPACGFRVLDERISVKGSEDGLLIEARRPANKRLLLVRVLRTPR